MEGALTSSPRPVADAAVMALCSDEADGLRQSAMLFGSDHLPVACDVRVQL